MLRYEDLRPFCDHKEFQSMINKCHNIIRDQEFCTPDQAFDELSKLLFCKIFDEKQIIDGDKENIEFYCDENDTAEIVAMRIAGKEKDTTDNLGIYGAIKHKYSTIFAQDKKEIKTIGLKPNTLIALVKEIQPYNLSNTDLDIKGSTYQILIKETFTGGRGLGQFFTPREIVKFIIKLIDPKEDDFLIDPACGTGGFLVEAIRYIAYTSPKKSNINNIFGIDANEKMAWTSQINMMIHNDGEGHIFRRNSLKLVNEYGNDDMANKFNIVVTNPPFGSRESNPAVLRDYELGSLCTNRKSQALEVLFIERCINLLKDNGRACIILPDGILSNPSLGYVREFIMEKAIIIGIISLPEETFKPYGTSVKTSIVMLKKKSEGELQKEVFMSSIHNVGYDSTGKKIDGSDFNDVINDFNTFRRNCYDEIF